MLSKLVHPLDPTAYDVEDGGAASLHITDTIMLSNNPARQASTGIETHL